MGPEEDFPARKEREVTSVPLPKYFRPGREVVKRTFSGFIGKRRSHKHGF